MSVDVVMPKLGLNMTEGVIVEWLKKEGDPVERGEPLFIVETDKITTESNAPASGRLSKIMIVPGEVVPVRTVVGLIQASSEETLEPSGVRPGPADHAVHTAAVQTVGWTAAIQTGEVQPAPGPASTQAKPGGPDRIPATPVAKRMAREHGLDLASIQGSGPGGRILQEDVERAIAQAKAEPKDTLPPQPSAPGRILASPVAKRLARENQIDLASLQGTGPDGHITQADVEHAIQARQPAQVPAAPSTPNSIPIEGIRAVISKRMSLSVQTTAQVTLHTETDATAMVAFRSALKAQAGSNGQPVPSYNAILVKLAAQALRQHPRLNATQVGETIQLQDQINIGLAVDTDAGLLVVVVKNADRKSVQDIDAELGSLVKRALSRRSLPEDLEGGTFTITNLGVFGIDGFTPIINPPEMAILGVGRIQEKLVIREGKVMQRHMLTLSLTFDHRLVDGAPAARFLQTICSSLEEL